MQRKKTTILIEFLVLVLLLHLFLGENISIKWTEFRYIVLLIIPAVFLPFFQQKTKNKMITFFFPVFSLVSTVPLIMKNVNNVNILNKMIWDELGFFLYYYVLIILIQTILLKFNYQKVALTLGTIFKTLLALYPLVFICYYFLYRDLLDANSVIAMYQTNLMESCEFIVSSASIIQIVFALIMIILLIHFNYKTSKNIYFECEKNFPRKYLLLILVVMIFLYPKLNNNYLIETVEQSKEYLNAVDSFQEFRSNNNIVAKTNLTGNKTFIIIIGESQNKEHLNAYGYARKNTPFMTGLLKNSNYIFYQNAFSNHTLTMKVLSKALTEANQYNNKSFEKSCSIIDIANAAGFNTVWISNQAKLGSYNTPITVISDLCKEQYWANENANWGNKYDESVLDYLQKIPKTGLNLVFIHLNGNHYEYKDRYPEKYEIFSDSSDVYGEVKNLKQLNEYDNSILYTDHILQKIFTFAQSELNSMGIIYFSDHGEDVRFGNKHIPGKFNMSMAKIPLIIYFSEEYKKENTQLYNNFLNNRQKYFTNDLMYDTMIGFLNIETKYSELENSLGSLKYSYEKKNIKILDGKIDLAKYANEF